MQSIVALGLMALASVGLGWAVAGRALAPLTRVTATARKLSQDNLHERLALGGPNDELKELADTFDAMLARLESAFESQRRFVANASHELRTPLAIQRTLVDVALADPDTSPADLRVMAAALRDAVDRSERLIDGLLVLARSEQGNVPREPVDLMAAAALALDQSAAEIAAGGLRVERALGPATVVGSRVLVERLVGNLVQNAVRHNQAGGWVKVETTAAAAGDGSGWSTPAPSWPPTRSTTCSSPSAACPPTGSTRPGASASACRSCARWRGPTAATCGPTPDPRAASTSPSPCRRRPRPRRPRPHRPPRSRWSPFSAPDRGGRVWSAGAALRGASRWYPGPARSCGGPSP